MRKYILTEENMPMVTGLIRKFLQSCQDKDNNLLDWIYYGKLSEGTKNRTGYYRSSPNPNDVQYVGRRPYTEEELESIRTSIFCDDPITVPNYMQSHIAISAPVKTSYRVGDIIYFVGGNRIIFQDGKYRRSLRFYDRECRRWCELSDK